MKVEYKAIIRGEESQLFSLIKVGDIVSKEADLETMLLRGGLISCCEGMSAAINSSNIIFDWKVCCNFHANWSEGAGEDIGIDFCPFCGEPITLEEIKRVRRVKQLKIIPEKTIDEWVEEDI